jgi:hypothetical protein
MKKESMRYQFSIEVERNLVRERYDGTVTLEDLIACSQEEWAHPNYRGGMDVIVDCRTASFQLTRAEMHDYAALLASTAAVGRQAIVVSTTLGRGLARMFELTAESSFDVWKDSRVFASIEEAERWLSGGK